MFTAISLKKDSQMKVGLFTTEINDTLHRKCGIINFYIVILILDSIAV